MRNTIDRYSKSFLNDAKAERHQKLHDALKDLAVSFGFLFLALYIFASLTTIS